MNVFLHLIYSIFLSALRGIVTCNEVEQIIESTKNTGGGSGSTSTPIQVDISKTPAQEGGTTTYSSGGNTMKVTKMRDVQAGTVNFQFYVHSSATGGPFTLSNRIKYDGGGTATLSGETKPIPNVYEVYYYKHNSQTKGALKVKTSSDTKIFHKTDVTNGGKWKNQAKEPVTPEAADLGTLVNQIKGEVEIKLEKSPRYISTPDGNGTITVVAIDDTTNTPKYKGFKHPVPNGSTINYISIRNQPISFAQAVTETDLQGKQFLFVYYSNDDGNYVKPLLICLSQNGGKGNSQKNKWYRRVASRTWTQETNGYDEINPGDIGKLTTNLGEIKGTLNHDAGYPILVDRNDDIPNETGVQSDVNIRIDKKEVGYNNTNGDDITDPNEITDGTIKVFLKNNEPKNGFTRYTHKVQGGTGKYKKMTTNVRFKNRGTEITKPRGGLRVPIQESNVRYVYIYHGGTSGNIPLLICVCTNSTGSDTFNYYAPQGRPSDANNNWSTETTLDQEPTSTYHDFLMHLDKLNDQANGETVVHIEKTETKGVNGSKQYITGRAGDTNITITKRDGSETDEQVPQGYMRYTHSFNPATSSPKFKHNGFELKFNPNPSESVTAVYVYYRANGQDHEHQFPLIVCVKKKSGGSPPQTYYKRGNQWTNVPEITVGPDQQGVASLLSGQFTNIIQQYEVKLEKSTSYGFISQIDVATPATPTVEGYTGYKHHKTGGTPNTFTIEKVRHNGNIVGGFPLPISNVDEVNVYYLKEDENHDKPLLLYTVAGGNSTTYTYYGKGMRNFQMHWWKIDELNKRPDPDVFEPHLEMLLYGLAILKNSILCNGGISPGNWGPDVNDAGDNVDKSKVGSYIDKVKDVKTGTETNPIDEDEFGTVVSASVVKSELERITIPGEQSTTGYDKFDTIIIQDDGSDLTAAKAAATVTKLEAIKDGSGYNTSTNARAKTFIDRLYTLINGYGKHTTPETAVPKWRTWNIDNGRYWWHYQ